MPYQGAFRGNPDNAPCAYRGAVQANTWYWWLEDDGLGGMERRWYAGGQTGRPWRAWLAALQERVTGIHNYNAQTDTLDPRHKPRLPTPATGPRTPPVIMRCSPSSLIGECSS